MLGLACRQLHAVQLVDAAAPCVGSQEAPIEAGNPVVVLSAVGSGDRRWGGDEVAQEMQDGTVEMVAAADSPGTLRTRRIGRRPTATCWTLRALQERC